MKSVLISIRPQWCEKITSGKKTIEVRKNAPKEVPFKCYIYETKGQYVKFTHGAHTKYGYGRGKVIGEFICDKVDEYPYDYCDGVDIDDDTILETAIDREDINIYTKGKTLYGWHISDLKIYDKPRELSEFYYCCKEMKANEPRAGKYVSLSCYACRHNALKRTEDYSEYNNMLGYICKRNITRPPQSWQYVEEIKNETI